MAEGDLSSPAFVQLEVRGHRLDRASDFIYDEWAQASAPPLPEGRSLNFWDCGMANRTLNSMAEQPDSKIAEHAQNCSSTFSLGQFSFRAPSHTQPTSNTPALATATQQLCCRSYQQSEASDYGTWVTDDETEQVRYGASITLAGLTAWGSCASSEDGSIGSNVPLKRNHSRTQLGPSDRPVTSECGLPVPKQPQQPLQWEHWWGEFATSQTCNSSASSSSNSSSSGIDYTTPVASAQSSCMASAADTSSFSATGIAACTGGSNVEAMHLQHKLYASQEELLQQQWVPTPPALAPQAHVPSTPSPLPPQPLPWRHLTLHLPCTYYASQCGGICRTCVALGRGADARAARQAAAAAGAPSHLVEVAGSTAVALAVFDARLDCFITPQVAAALKSEEEVLEVVSRLGGPCMQASPMQHALMRRRLGLPMPGQRPRLSGSGGSHQRQLLQQCNGRSTCSGAAAEQSRAGQRHRQEHGGSSGNRFWRWLSCFCCHDV